MPARSGFVLLIALAAPFAACGGDDGSSSGGTTPKSTDVEGRAARFASCARKSDYKVVRPEPPNERADFLRGEGFTFAEVDLEEPPVLFFTAIADFFPSRAEAGRAKERIASSLAGPSTVQKDSVVVHYTDDPGTPERAKAEGVVNDCLRQ
jgi:hypothetical protein